MFLFAALCLGALACVFAVWPLARPRASSGVDHEQFMRDLYRERVAELESEARDEALRAEMADELGAVLLAEHQAAQPAAQPWRSSRGVLAGVALLAVALGYGAYLTVADVGQLDIAGAEEVMLLSAESERAAVESWSERLARRVAQRPDDAKSWYLLGHARLKLGSFQQAAEAFASTHALVSDDLVVQSYWLQARYLAAEGRLDDVSARLARDILSADPGNASVLEILALDSFQRGDSPTAIRHLNRALQSTRDPARQATLGVALRQARALLDPAPPGIEVDVAAAHPVPKSATVFVIARPVGGGMPYAVVKRPAVMVPFTVTVDDLVSMSEDRRLSGAEAFEVAVRLSRSGVAMAEEGDWLWVSDPVAAGQLGSGVKIAASLAPPNFPSQ